jgi:hypothetical protein
MAEPFTTSSNMFLSDLDARKKAAASSQAASFEQLNKVLQDQIAGERDKYKTTTLGNQAIDQLKERGHQARLTDRPLIASREDIARRLNETNLSLADINNLGSISNALVQAKVPTALSTRAGADPNALDTSRGIANRNIAAQTVKRLSDTGFNLTPTEIGAPARTVAQQLDPTRTGEQGERPDITAAKVPASTAEALEETVTTRTGITGALGIQSLFDQIKTQITSRRKAAGKARIVGDPADIANNLLWKIVNVDNLMSQDRLEGLAEMMKESGLRFGDPPFLAGDDGSFVIDARGNVTVLVNRITDPPGTAPTRRKFSLKPKTR